MNAIRLNKFLAQAGIASRRKVEKLIKAGYVKINGRLIKEPSFKIDPRIHKVEIKNKLIKLPPKVYYLFYKPKGYLTTLYDPHGRPTIKKFLSKIPYRVFPVGRLDKNTEGLLLLTNDGDLAHRLLHPSYQILRIYHAEIKGNPKREILENLLLQGVEVEGRRIRPKKIKFLQRKRNTTLWEVAVGEGRKREVRKIFASIGHPVIALKRISFGPFTLKGLRKGEIREFTPKEKELLKLL